MLPALCSPPLPLPARPLNPCTVCTQQVGTALHDMEDEYKSFYSSHKRRVAERDWDLSPIVEQSDHEREAGEIYAALLEG